MIDPASTQRSAKTTRVAGAENGAKAFVDRVIARWREGGKADAVSVLREHPGIVSDKSLVLDLALEEYCLRRERGDRLGPETFRERFESLGDSLAASIGRQVEIEDLYDRQRTQRERNGWPTTGDQVLGFRLFEEIGRGGLARVYLCQDEAVGDRPVVVKISRGQTSEPHWLGRLNHPNIVPILSASTVPEVDGSLVCMPYLGRCTLHDLVSEADGSLDGLAYLARVADADGPTASALEAWRHLDSYQVVLALCRGVASGLAHAHKKGIVHGDVKSSNILVNASGALLFDFNLSFGCGIEQAQLGGTLPYLAPERVESLLHRERDAGRSATPSLDAFAFGLTLADLLMSSRQEATSTLSVMDASGAEQLYASQSVHVEAARAKLPVESLLGPLLQACICRDPARRPTAAEICDVIENEQHRLVRKEKRAGTTRRTALAMAGTGLCAWLVRNAVSGPTSAEQYALGKGQLEEGRYEEAVGSLGEVLRLDPDHIGARYSRAWAWISSGDLASAIRDLRIILRIGGDAYAAASLGYCRAQRLEYSEGAAWYGKVIGPPCDDAEVLNNQACCHWKGRTASPPADQIELAREKFARAGAAGALDATPQLNRVLMEIELLRQERGAINPNAARSLTEELISLDQSDDVIVAAIYLHALVEQSNATGGQRSIELLEQLLSVHVGPAVTWWEQDPAFAPMRRDGRIDSRVRRASRHAVLPSLRLLPHPVIHPLYG